MSRLEQLAKQPESNLGTLICGQGMQKEDMLGVLLRSTDPEIRASAEEVILGKDGLIEIRPDVVDVYTTNGADPAKLNDTVFVQPGTAALVIALFKAYQKKLGVELTPDVAGGYSLGDYISSFMLGVLSQRDVLNLVSTRGEVFKPLNQKIRRIEPGQYSIVTLITDGSIDENRLNKHFHGTGFKVTITQAKNAYTIAGPESSRPALDSRLSELKTKGSVVKTISLPKDVFKDPFHLDYVMEPFAADFNKRQKQYCQAESKQRVHHVFLEPRGDGGFVTGDGRVLTSGTDIMKYLGFSHIKNPFDSARMMELIGAYSRTVIGFGGLAAQRRFSQPYGHIANFLIVDLDPSSQSGVIGLEAAVAATAPILEQREKARETVFPKDRFVPAKTYRQPT